MGEGEKGDSKRVSFRAVLDIVASLAMIGTAGLLAWVALAGGAPPSGAAAGPTLPIPLEPLSLDGAPRLGVPSAPVALVEFSDFECLYCSRFANEVLPMLKKKYIDSGLVQLAFRHLPLPNHARAIPAAVAAECAFRQGLFWPLHDRLFADPTRLSEDDLRQQAASAGVDLAAFDLCGVNGDVRSRIDVDLQLAKTLQIAGTPAFFVGFVSDDGFVRIEQTVQGARRLEDFERVLDEFVERP